MGGTFGLRLCRCGPHVFRVRVWCDWRKILVLQLVVPKAKIVVKKDEDKLSFFKLVGILKDDLNCTCDFKLWWTGVHDVCLKELALDSDAIELVNFALSNNIEVLVHVEKINDGGVVVSKGDVVALDDGDEDVGVEVVGSESDSSDTKSNEGDSESGSENDNKEDRHKFVIYKKEELSGDFEFKIGMDFGSLQEFKEAIVDCSIMNGREVVFRPNDKVRARAKCKEKHGNKNDNSKWVSKIATEKLKSSDDVKLTQIMDVVRLKYDIGITLVIARKAKMIAKAIVDGDVVRQYCYLEAYGEELKHVCAGNNYKLILERPPGLLRPRFGSFCMCLDASKLTFKRAYRPIIGLDGCHLKNKFGGQLSIVVGRDPNDQYLPIAFVMVENQTKDTWKWFLKLLINDIGDIEVNKWIFISDQQKKKFGGGTLLRDLMMGAAKATYEEAWEDKMAHIKEKNAENPSSVLPPKYKRGIGRLKKLRRREVDEDLNPTKLREKTTEYQCRRCEKLGHNQRKCDLPPLIVEEPKNEGTVIQLANEANAKGGTFAIKMTTH
ncbi:hypothetical protein JHK86_043270 [Glycine max]|nr:hypothetical protein JHK86_043270 [Glycine max]